MPIFKTAKYMRTLSRPHIFEKRFYEKTDIALKSVLEIL